VRAGFGHSYWSAFGQKNQQEIVTLAKKLNRILFEPEVMTPIRTLDLPLGGSSSSVEALAVLIDFLSVANNADLNDVDAGIFADDSDGVGTISALKGGIRIANRVTGNSAESLGLHPYVYFSNEKGKHSRFLFLGTCALIADRLRNNDDLWFRKFTIAREHIEKFLLENKSLIGIVLQNLGRKARIPKMREMLAFLVQAGQTGKVPEAREVFENIGLRGKVIDLTNTQKAVRFSEDVKSAIYLRDGVKQVMTCPICRGLLDVQKSVSYDHVTPVRAGGLGTAENGQMVHPYCNTGMKS
jgi:hypothetical protein